MMEKTITLPNAESKMGKSARVQPVRKVTTLPKPWEPELRVVGPKGRVERRALTQVEATAYPCSDEDCWLFTKQVYYAWLTPDDWRAWLESGEYLPKQDLLQPFALDRWKGRIKVITDKETGATALEGPPVYTAEEYYNGAKQTEDEQARYRDKMDIGKVMTIASIALAVIVLAVIILFAFSRALGSAG